MSIRRRVKPWSRPVHRIGIGLRLSLGSVQRRGLCGAFSDPILDCYLALIRQSKLMAKRIAHGRCGNLRACAATSFLDECPVSDHFIKIGEAALSIDALSSQGVQTPISTALHAAVVINTMTDRPGDTPLTIFIDSVSAIHGNSTPDLQECSTGNNTQSQKPAFGKREPVKQLISPKRRQNLCCLRTAFNWRTAF
jgi:hypothetical protein